MSETARRSLLWVREFDKDEEAYLHLDDGTWIVDDEAIRQVGAEELSLEQLADFCDGNAESRNNHAFIGNHRMLAALLHARLGRGQATAIFREIAERGGLDGMAGIGRCGPDSFGDFGIRDYPHDWAL